MHEQQPMKSNEAEMLQEALGVHMKPGELGVVLAFAGAGKTACLTHIAVEHLLSGVPVLHVCIDEIPEKIKIWYHEFLKNIAATKGGEDLAVLQHRTEPLRFILAYLHHTFSPDRLEQSLQNLKEQAKFNPSVVILDGLNFDEVSRSTVEMLQEFAHKNGVSMWMSARTHRHITTVNERGIPYPCHEMDDLFTSVLLLEPGPDAIRVKILKHEDHDGSKASMVFLNSHTYLLQNR